MKNQVFSRIAVLAIAMVVAFAPAALAQSTMIKGKVIGANKEPIVGVQVTVEFLGGVNRKLQTKTDKRGEFIQLLTEGGQYKITATDPKIGSVSNVAAVRLGRVSDM
ncbi:MAG TPA: carboxypeptidase-like regulatory domain-containing protein, partial [Vicinamibacterales bacterium]